jgi:hypothetical protein
MNAKRIPLACQIQCLPQLAQPVNAIDKLSNILGRIKRFLKRRTIFMKNWLLVHVDRRGRTNLTDINSENSEVAHLQAGDLVCVKSKDAIQLTLDRWNGLRGCAFLEEMWAYCGTTQHVMKRMEKFLDERDYQMKRAGGTVLLYGVICNGTVDFGRCDRSCFFFWREEWLEKVG